MDVTEKTNFQMKGIQLCESVKQHGLDGYVCEKEKKINI